MINISYIAKQLGNAKKHGTGFMCSCPGSNHKRGDQHPSLKISFKDGNLLLYCFAGCTFEELIKLIKERGLIDSGTSFNLSLAQTPATSKEDIKNQKLVQHIWNKAKHLLREVIDITKIEALMISGYSQNLNGCLIICGLSQVIPIILMEN